MENTVNNSRVDTGSKVIKASPQTIYQAYLDPEAVMQWRPPQGMKCMIYEFDPWIGGHFRMAFIYTSDDHTPGKTSEHVDEFKGRFQLLVPNEKIVETVEFESEDEAYAGTMKVITTLLPTDGGTEVTIRIENVPPGISAEDHEAGIKSTLTNLAKFTENK